MPKLFLNNSKTTLKKSRNWFFLHPKWSKMTISLAKFWKKISIFDVIYKPFELKIHPKVGLLSQKTLPKYFLSFSKTTLKKSKNHFFEPKMDKTRMITLEKKVHFWDHFWDFSSNFALLGLKKVSLSRWSCLKKID